MRTYFPILTSHLTIYIKPHQRELGTLGPLCYYRKGEGAPFAGQLDLLTHNLKVPLDFPWKERGS